MNFFNIIVYFYKLWRRIIETGYFEMLKVFFVVFYTDRKSDFSVWEDLKYKAS